MGRYLKGKVIPTSLIRMSVSAKQRVGILYKSLNKGKCPNKQSSFMSWESLGDGYRGFHVRERFGEWELPKEEGRKRGGFQGEDLLEQQIMVVTLVFWENLPGPQEENSVEEGGFC